MIQNRQKGRIKVLKDEVDPYEHLVLSIDDSGSYFSYLYHITNSILDFKFHNDLFTINQKDNVAIHKGRNLLTEWRMVADYAST